jgi:hypothetical protein
MRSHEANYFRTCHFHCCPLGGIIFTHYHTQEKPSTWEVYFSPHGKCTDTIIRELDRAKTSVLVQGYSFTSASIAKALLNSHKRGVKVEVILDKSQRTDKYSSATFFFNMGIHTKIDVQHAIAHNKVMIIDGEDGDHGFVQLHEAIDGYGGEQPIFRIQSRDRG